MTFEAWIQNSDGSCVTDFATKTYFHPNLISPKAKIPIPIMKEKALYMIMRCYAPNDFPYAANIVN